MTSSTKQFIWKDRDTAAHDLLQLVYHAPPYLSLLAAGLLIAFRSSQTISELVAIVLDDQQKAWHRIYALRAIGKTPGNVLVYEFADIAHTTLTSHKHEELLLGRLLSEFFSLADEHPSNRAWLFEALAEADVVVQRDLLRHHLYNHSAEFKQECLKRLLNLLDAQPGLLDLATVTSLVEQDEMAQVWLDTHLDRVLTLCEANQQNHRQIRRIARHWSKLREMLEHDAAWTALLADPVAPLTSAPKNLLAYRDAPAYAVLMALYDRAQQGQHAAYQCLVKLARKRQGNIPVRAVATHMIGKLHPTFDVLPVLAQLLRYGDVDWRPNLFDAPIRYEAGAALLQFPTAATWEVLVDSYFILPRDDLLPFQIDWITYITDRLSGVETDYQGWHCGTEADRAWFRLLTEVSSEEMKW